MENEEERQELSAARNEALDSSLDQACLRYLEVRARWTATLTSDAALEEIDAARTQAHDTLLAAFHAFLGSQKTKNASMLKAQQGGRKAVGVYGIERAVRLVLRR